MSDVSEYELVVLIAHALHHSGPPSNAERIDMDFAIARASIVVRELVDREGLLFTRRPEAAHAPAEAKRAPG